MNVFENYFNSFNYEKKQLILITTSIVHFLNDMFVCLYPYFFAPIYDFYFAIFGVMTTISWLFLKNECFLSVIEKKMVDSNYEIGSKPYNNPYHKIFYTFNGVNYSFIKETFWLLTFLLIIFYRKNSKFVKYMLCVMIIFVIILKAPQFLEKK